MKRHTRFVRHGIVAGLLALGVIACVDNRGTQSVVQTGPVTLAAVQATIFTPRCATSGCHDSSGPFGLNLRNGSSFGNTVGVVSAEVPAFERVTPFDSANSYLFMKVTGDPRILGNPMPDNPPLLNAEQLRLIADWIDAGALE